MCAGGDDFFHRPLADQLMVMLAFRHHHRHAASLEIKGDFINLFVIFGQLQVGEHLDMLQHGAVQQVFQAGLVVAVEVGKPQSFL